MQEEVAAEESGFLGQAAMVPQERHKTRQQAVVVDRLGPVEGMELGCNTLQRGTRAAMAERMEVVLRQADTGMMVR